MTQVLMGYVTFKDAQEAQSLCGKMVEQRVIACANILPAHLAIYECNGNVQSSSEVTAIVKTTADRERQIQEFITAHHSYSTPCAVFWPIEQGPDKFLQWIYKQTHD